MIERKDSRPTDRFRRILRKVGLPILPGFSSGLKLIHVKPITVDSVESPPIKPPADLTGSWRVEKRHLVHETDEMIEIFGNGAKGVIFEKDKTTGHTRTFEYLSDDSLSCVTVTCSDGNGYCLKYLYEPGENGDKKSVGIEKQDFQTVGQRKIKKGQPQRIKW